MKIPAPHGFLEANLRPTDGPVIGAGVFCHPHPLFGGTMNTKCVFRSAQAMAEVGIPTLRFNFRGVGLSTGSYDEGLGEQDDARVALDWVAGEFPDAPLVLGGFSFGSIVALRVGLADPRVKTVIGLGLPANSADLSFLEEVDKPVLLIHGSKDDVAPIAPVEELLENASPLVEWHVIEGADHYFYDYLDPLKEAVAEFLSIGSGARALQGI